MIQKFLIAQGEHLTVGLWVHVGADGKIRRATAMDSPSFQVSPYARIDNEAGTLEIPLNHDPIQLPDHRWQVGSLVFQNSGQAWRHIDRLDGEPISRSEDVSAWIVDNILKGQN